jgi:hypothetical protein
MSQPDRKPDRDPPSGPFGWPGLGRYLRGPEGLEPLSRRRRDVAIRWLGFAAAVIVMVAIFAVLFLARRA